MLRTCLVLAQIFVLSGPISAQEMSSTTVKSGRKIFQTRCSMCHVGQAPATELADGTSGQQWTFGPLLSKTHAANETTLSEKIKNGGPKMPGYSLALTNEQIDQVIAFMKTIEEPLTKLANDLPGE